MGAAKAQALRGLNAVSRHYANPRGTSFGGTASGLERAWTAHRPVYPAKPSCKTVDWAFLHAFRWRLPLLWPILAACAAGILFGWYYYAQVGQFDLADPACATSPSPCQPWWLWPLVADSPNAVLVFVAAATLHRFAHWRHKALDAAAFTLNLYVGLWTTLLFLSYPDTMGTFDLGSTNNVLFVTHMGMPLLSLTLVHRMRQDAWRPVETATVLLLLALFVAVDYWGPHLHPAPFLHHGPGDMLVGMPGDAWLSLASPALMLATAALWLTLARPRRVPSA
jgi:uncharacterized membrane protein YpjA